MSNNKNNSGEEIDLGSLFMLIGKGLKEITTAISNVIISILLFFKKNLLFLIIPVFIGALYGYFLEKKTGQKFESSLHVVPNFESTIHLYESIKGYNNLISENEIAALSNIFSITEEEAKSLKGFKIEPVKKIENVIAFYRKELDTIKIDEKYTFLDFKETFSTEDYKLHKISVIATKNNIFKKLTQPIISSINNNNFLNKRKVISNEGMSSKKDFLERKLTEIDSVLKTNYNTLKTEQKSKIDVNYLMGNLNEKSTVNADIVRLLENNLSFKNKLIETNSYIYERSNMINLISNFQEVGAKIKIFKTKSKVHKYALRLFLISLSILLLLSVNRYLTKK